MNTNIILRDKNTIPTNNDTIPTNKNVTKGAYNMTQMNNFSNKNVPLNVSKFKQEAPFSR